MKYKKIIGIILIVFALSSAYLLFSAKIKDGSAKEWNAGPLIFGEVFLIGFGVSLMSKNPII